MFAVQWFDNVVGRWVYADARRYETRALAEVAAEHVRYVDRHMGGGKVRVRTIGRVWD